MNPIALALRRLGFDALSVGYTEIRRREPAITDDGLAFFVSHHVVDLPEEAQSFMRGFGYSLGGKESKRSFEARKALRRTSSDHKTAVRPVQQGKLVEPFEFAVSSEGFC